MNCVQVREDTSSLGMGWKGSQYLQRTERGRKLRLSDQWRQEKNQEKMASQEESREDPGRTLTLRASTIAKWRMAEPPSHSQSQGVIRCSPVHSLIPQLRNPSPRNVTRLVWGIMANSWEVCHWQPKFIEVGMKLLDFSTSLPLKIYTYIYFNQHISSSVFLMSTYGWKTLLCSKPGVGQNWDDWLNSTFLLLFEWIITSLPGKFIRLSLPKYQTTNFPFELVINSPHLAPIDSSGSYDRNCILPQPWLFHFLSPNTCYLLSPQGMETLWNMQNFLQPGEPYPGLPIAQQLPHGFKKKNLTRVSNLTTNLLYNLNYSLQKC